MLIDPGGVPPGWHPFDVDTLTVQDALHADSIIQEYNRAILENEADEPTPEEKARLCVERPRWCKRCKVKDSG